MWLINARVYKKQIKKKQQVQLIRYYVRVFVFIHTRVYKWDRIQTKFRRPEVIH